MDFRDGRVQGLSWGHAKYGAACGLSSGGQLAASGYHTDTGAKTARDATKAINEGRRKKKKDGPSEKCVTIIMQDKVQELIPTRRSLLTRLKKWDDQESWQDFF